MWTCKADNHGRAYPVTGKRLHSASQRFAAVPGHASIMRPSLVVQLKMFLPMIIMYGFNKYGSDWRMDHIRIAYGVSQVLVAASAA